MHSHHLALAHLRLRMHDKQNILYCKRLRQYDQQSFMGQADTLLIDISFLVIGSHTHPSYGDLFGS
jgi:hypothetical protein